MSNGISLHQETITRSPDFKSIWASIKYTDLMLKNLSDRIYGKKIKRVSKPVKKSKISKNPINASGFIGEDIVQKHILSFIDDTKLNIFHKYNRKQIDQFTIKIPQDIIKKVGQYYIDPDMIIENKFSETKLYIEVKRADKDGSALKLVHEKARQYAMLNKPILFVVSGDYYTESIIDNRNEMFMHRDESDYVIMIHYTKLQEFFDIWTNNNFTNFKEIQIIMNSNNKQLFS